MIFFIVPVGNVVGQQSYTNALRIDVYDKCEFKTMEFYKFQQAWFIFESKDSLTQITVADHIATYAPAPVFDTVIVYDKNMSVVAVFAEDTTDWSEIVSTPMVGTDYYLFVKSNSYFDKCDFDMCLKDVRLCVPIIDFELSRDVICLGDSVKFTDLTWHCPAEIPSIQITPSVLINDAVSNPIGSFGLFYPATLVSGTEFYFFPNQTGWHYVNYCILDTEINYLYCKLDSFYVDDSLHNTMAMVFSDTIDAFHAVCETVNIPSNFCHIPCNTDTLIFVDSSDPWTDEIDYIFSDDSVFSPAPPLSELFYETISPGDTIEFPVDWLFNLEFTCSDTLFIRQIYKHACDTDTTYMSLILGPPVIDFEPGLACFGDSIHFEPLIICGDTMCLDSLCDHTFASDSIMLVWNFGDGSPLDTSLYPSHLYSNPGTYHVTLSAFIQEYLCQFDTTKDVYINAPPVIIVSGPTYACDSNSLYTIVNYDPHTVYSYSIDSWNPAQYYWDAQTPLQIPWNGTGGVIFFYATDGNGCFGYDSIFVFDCCFSADGTGHMYMSEPFSFPTTGIDNEVFYFNGEITFEPGTNYTFTYCHFYMGENAKVLVKSGAHVDIGKSGIIEACSGIMWDGFYIENGGELIIHGSNINQPVYVRDAKNAVHSLNGGKFTLNSIVMDKNFKHIVVDPYPGLHSGTVKHTVMSCSGTLLPQYPPVIAFRTQDAITVNNVSSIVIGEKNAGNTISNCDIGILSMNSFIRVVGNTFSNIETPTSIAIGQPSHPRGYGIYTFSFLTSATNPNGLSTMPSTLSKSGGNTFTNVTNGIYSFNNGQIYIARNTFDYPNNSMGRGTAISLAEWSHPATNKTITTNAISNYNKGILVTGTNNARVSGNTISNLKLIPASFSNLRAMGIRIEGGSNNIVQGNTVQNNNAASADWRWEGISVSNSGSLVVSCNTLRKMGKSIRFQGVNDPVQIKKNAMFNGTAGIVLSDGGFINDQGSNGIHWDNTWHGFAYSTGRHLYTMNSTDASLIVFHLYHNAVNQGFDNSAQSGSQPFAISEEINSLFMLCATPIMSASPTYSSWMDDVAANTNANLQAPLHRNWMGRNGLYRTLKEDSLLAQNASLQSFVLQLESESQGQLKKVADTLLLNDYLAAKQLNQNLPVYTKPDSLSKSANSIYISAALSGADNWSEAITATGWDSLRYFASLCPFEYGENVYLSRIVLKLIGDTTEYYNECEFDEVETPDKNAVFGNNDEAFTTVYPNPAKSEITIETEMVLPATLTLYSTLGEELFSIQIVEEQSTINFGNIHPQLVMYKIQNSNGETSRGTLTIIE